jgi:hypothetical protein
MTKLSGFLALGGRQPSLGGRPFLDLDTFVRASPGSVEISNIIAEKISTSVGFLRLNDTRCEVGREIFNRCCAHLIGHKMPDCLG